MEQTFVDSTQQLILRLGPELLVFLPTDRRGWQCRVDEIAWTSSVMTSRGIREIHLHARNGRMVTLFEFDGIERFYIALLRQLTGRGWFDPVRDQLPAQVPLLERVLWLSAQSEADGPWLAAAAGTHSAVAATREGLLVMASGAPRIERVGWERLVGVRFRPGCARFYLEDGWLEVAAPDLPDRFAPLCARQVARQEALRGPLPFRIPGVEAASRELALDFSWEIAAARDLGLLRNQEVVAACAFGVLARGNGAAPRPVDEEPADLEGGRSSGAAAVKTEWVLTDRRLVTMDRERASNRLLHAGEVALEPLPLLRRHGHSLALEGATLVADPEPAGMAERFMHSYREVARERLPAFAPEPQLRARNGQARNWSVPDPFSSEVEVG